MSPGLRFAVPLPSQGTDALLYAAYQPRRWLQVYVQGRSETQERQVQQVDGVGRVTLGLHEEMRQSIRLHGDYSFSPSLRLRARVEGVRYTQPGTEDAWGTLLYQEVRWQPSAWLRADARLLLFDTDTFDARVFAYEQDLLYTFAVPAFSGRGQRSYLLLTAKLSADLVFEGKFSVTRFEDVSTVGSGLDETEGNRLRDVRLQLRWRL